MYGIIRLHRDLYQRNPMIYCVLNQTTLSLRVCQRSDKRLSSRVGTLSSELDMFDGYLFVKRKMCPRSILERGLKSFFGF